MAEQVTYLVIGRDGKQYGPASEQDIREWTAVGRVTPETLSWCAGESSWRPLRLRTGLLNSPTIAAENTHQLTCAEKAKQYVHRAAAGGAAIAPIPIPGIGTAGLVTLEGSLIYWIGRVYGERLTPADIAAITGTLGVGSLVVKMGVMEALNFVPVLGWTLKSGIAVGIIETIGNLTVKHFESRHPGKLYTVDIEVEQKISGAGSPTGDSATAQV
jgi:uncharacterized protein (DUF697 family)